MSRILLIEDEPDIALMLAEDLRCHEYEVEIVGDGLLGATRAREPGWDLILLDVMLPRKDGFEVCRELRRHSVQTPILLLTARSQEGDKVLGLEFGADDYVTKPFSPRELRARIAALLRRSLRSAAKVHRIGDLELDETAGEVRKSGNPIEITPIEFRLLSVFIRNRGRVLSREQLIDGAWGPNIFVSGRAVDTHIVNLRRKIESDPSSPNYIVSVRAMGYRLNHEVLTKP